jgi:hypothetical protein
VSRGQRPARSRHAGVHSVPPPQLHNGEEPPQQPRAHRAAKVLPLVLGPHGPSRDPLTLREGAGLVARANGGSAGGRTRFTALLTSHQLAENGVCGRPGPEIFHPSQLCSGRRMKPILEVSSDGSPPSEVCLPRAPGHPPPGAFAFLRSRDGASDPINLRTSGRAAGWAPPTGEPRAEQRSPLRGRERALCDQFARQLVRRKGPRGRGPGV